MSFSQEFKGNGYSFSVPSGWFVLSDDSVKSNIDRLDKQNHQKSQYFDFALQNNFSKYQAGKPAIFILRYRGGRVTKSEIGILSDPNSPENKQILQGVKKTMNGLADSIFPNQLYYEPIYHTIFSSYKITFHNSKQILLSFDIKKLMIDGYIQIIYTDWLHDYNEQLSFFNKFMDGCKTYTELNYVESKFLDSIAFAVKNKISFLISIIGLGSSIFVIKGKIKR
jgi:hypothetical protein